MSSLSDSILPMLEISKISAKLSLFLCSIVIILYILGYPISYKVALAAGVYIFINGGGYSIWSIFADHLKKRKYGTICPQCGSALFIEPQYICPNCGKLIFDKKDIRRYYFGR